MTAREELQTILIELFKSSGIVDELKSLKQTDISTLKSLRDLGELAGEAIAKLQGQITAQAARISALDARIASALEPRDG